MSISPIKVVIADDHEIFLDGMHVLLKKIPNIDIVGEARNGRELLQVVREEKPDVVVTDIKMPVMDGIEATKILIRQMPGIGVIALSMFEEESLIVEMLQAGAKGYLLKNAQKQEIINAIETVHRNQTYYCTRTSNKLLQMIVNSNYNPHKKEVRPELTEKEKFIIQLICQQLSNKEIATELNLSVRTVEGYRDRIEEKIKARNTAGIVVYAIKNGIYTIR